MISTWRSPVRNANRVHRTKRAIELKAKASSSRTISSSSRSGTHLDLQGRGQRQIINPDGFTIDYPGLRSSRFPDADLDRFQHLEHVFLPIAAALPIDVVDAQQLDKFYGV